MIPLPYKLLALVLLCVALTGGYFGWRQHQRAIGAEAQRVVDAQAIQAQKDAAARILAEKTAEIRAAEKTLRAFVDAQEVQSAKDRKTVDDLGRRLRAAMDADRLRDPNARPGDCRAATDRGTAAPAVDSADDPAPAGGFLSAEITQLLAELTAEADEVNSAYAACRGWAVEVKAQTKPDE